MKIGKYNRVIKDFCFPKHMKVYDIRIILLLNEVMWMGSMDIMYNIVAGKKTVLDSLNSLKDRGYIKLARVNNNFKKLEAKYCITDKGRSLAQEFINKLN